MRCQVCNCKDRDIIQGKCPSCRAVLADQLTEKEILDIWDEASDSLRTEVKLNDNPYEYFS